MIDSKGNDKEKAFIATASGKKFFILEPRLEDIDIYDIAHSLALQCRWTGHTKYHYSIAQHSYYCSFIGPDSEAFDRLMHDAAEAYTGDMNRPLKHYTEAGTFYRKVEANVQHAIAARFGFSVVEPKSVKLADNSMLYAEKDQITNAKFEEAQVWESYTERPAAWSGKWPIEIEEWSPDKAKQIFLTRFEDLYKGRIN
jgi:5'-deoxynucleotidase YfbR-like HD superfamily hydrolase